MEVPVWKPWIFLFIVLSLLIIAGNVLALVVFFVAKPLPHNVRCLLINLACADTLVGTLAVPMYIYLVAAAYTGKLDTNSEVPLVYTAIDIFAAFGSIFSLVAIAIERLSAIAWPLKHQGTPSYMYYIALLCIWLGAAVMSTLFLLQGHTIISIKGFFIPMITCFFLTVVVIFAVYTFLWVAVARIKHDEAGGSRTVEKKLGITFLLVTLFFIFMWLPFQILNIIVHDEKGCHTFECKFELVALTKLLHYGNSLVNPIIYSFRIPGFKKAAIQLLCHRNTRFQDQNVTLNTYDNQGYKSEATMQSTPAELYPPRYEHDNPNFNPSTSPVASSPKYKSDNPNFNQPVSPGNSSRPSIYI